jgi:hypothetical protein
MQKAGSGDSATGLFRSRAPAQASVAAKKLPLVPTAAISSAIWKTALRIVPSCSSGPDHPALDEHAISLPVRNIS